MSTSSITELVLAELEVPHEVVIVDIRAGGTKKPEFIKINPNGKVPVIVHDGTVIWESTAITMYLGETFGVQKGLYPAAGPLRGEAMKWITWSNVTLGNAVFRWTHNTMDWVPEDHRNAKAGEAGKADVLNCLRILDEALEGKEFLCGTYSLADTHLNSFIDWLRMMKVDMSAFSRLNAWGQRCSARPAYVRLMSSGK
jgi:glutathione S-transferase